MYDLSRMTQEERISWHTKRVESEELLSEVTEKILLKETTSQIQDEIRSIRAEVSRLSRKESLRNERGFVEKLRELRACASKLGVLQRDRMRLLRGRLSGRPDADLYNNVKNAFSIAVADAAGVSVELLNLVGVDRAVADRYIVAMYVFEGFKKKYDELIVGRGPTAPRIVEEREEIVAVYAAKDLPSLLSATECTDVLQSAASRDYCNCGIVGTET